MKERLMYVSREVLTEIKSGQRTEIRKVKGLELVNRDSKAWTFSHFARDTDPYNRLIAVFHGIKIPISKMLCCPYGMKGDNLFVRDMDEQRAVVAEIIKIYDIRIDRLMAGRDGIESGTWVWNIKFQRI
jgi:hypothetical protein